MLRPLNNVLLFVALLLVVASLSWFYLWPDGPPPGGDSGDIRANAIDEVVAVLPAPISKTETAENISALVNDSGAAEARPPEFYQSLPASLADAPPPGALGLDEKGNLIADQRVRELFEFYLMAMGEEPLEDIVARIQYALRSQLEEPAYTQANVILEGYLQYRNHIGVINNRYAEQSGAAATDLTTIREMKQAVRESRSDFLSDDVSTAFFAKEDAYDSYMINRAVILTAKNVSEEERQRQLELLDLNSSPDLVRAQRENYLLSNVSDTVARKRRDGASDSEIYAYRQQQLGVEAAERLSVLDAERQQWQSRLDAYRLELASLESAQEYPPEEREHLVEELRAQHFSEQEILRVRVLDKTRGDAAK